MTTRIITIAKTMTVVLTPDGAACLGYTLSRGKQGIEAFDSRDTPLGIFPNLEAAAAALADPDGACSIS
jgi:hypothetical protein